MLLVFLGWSSNLLFADSITVEQAKTVAGNFYSSRSHIGNQDIQRTAVTLELYSEQKNDDMNFCYIFNVGNKQGFVIISADDDAFPVLAYSFKGSFDIENIAPATREMLESYHQQILEIQTKHLKADENIKQQWKNFSSEGYYEKGITDVDPLLITTWSQGLYYNTDCPVDADGPDGHALVGCVATAMSQIMKYHSYPPQGTGSHTYYHPDYGNISADFGNSVYDWASMPDDASAYNDALALICSHCGVSVEMQYGPDGSGAYTSDVASALMDYFDYKNTAQFVSKENYSTAEWDAILVGEINNNRPIEYKGHGPDGGHAFVLDGYQGASNNHYHFNWGWGGYADGYYYIDNLNPGSYTFNDYQGAVIGIEPNVAGNYPPTVINPISNVSLDEGFGTYAIDISNVFNDPNGDPLTYTVVSSNTAVVTVSLSGTTLTITESSNGSSTVTVTANDGNGGTVDDSFSVVVHASSFAPPTNLSVTNDGYATWEPPEEGPTGFNDDFESYTDFVLEFDPWTLVDVDGSATYGFTNYDFENEHYTGSYIIFNPSETDPPLEDVLPHSGDKMAACFAATDALNDDWMVSPSVAISSGDVVSFWAKSYTDQYGLERFNVAVSTTGTDPGDFTIISGSNYIEAPLAWTEYVYDLSAYDGQDVYVAIQCVSADAFILFIDDFHMGAPSKVVYPTIPVMNGSASREIAAYKPAVVVPDNVKSSQDLLGYNVYLNGNYIQNTSNLYWQYTGLTEGDTYTAGVSALYDGGESVIVEYEFTVPITNSPPIVINPLADIDLDEGFGTHNVDFTNVFEDPDGDALSYTVSSSNTSVVGVSISGNNVVITEAGVGSATVTLTADDGNGGTVSDVFTVTVNAAANNAPIVINPLADIYLDEGFGTHNVDFTNVFEDPDGDALSYTVSSSNTSVVGVSISGNNVVITEAGVGSATVTLTADDGNGGTVSDVFTVSVNAAANNAPIVINPLADIYLDEGFGTHNVDFTNVFEDPDGDALSYSVSSSNTSVVGVSVSGNNVVITEAGVGSATVTLTADDGNGGTVSDVFTVTVNAVANNAPIVINPLADIDLDEGFGTHNVDFTNVFEDPDGDALSYSVTSSNTSVVGVSISGNNVVITEAGVGSATVTLTANDGNGGTVSDVFTVTVNAAANNAPIVINPLADIYLDEGFGTHNVDFTNVFEDPDGDALSYSVSSSNTSVVGVSISGNNVVITEAGVGSATVTLTADDGNGGTVSDVFTVTVNAAANNAPIVINPLADIDLDEGFGTHNVDFTNVFEDPDGDALSYSVTSSNTSVVGVSISGNNVVITEAGVGSATVTLTADDGNGGTVSDVFTVTVNAAANNAPIVINPLADIDLDEGFGTHNVDFTNVFEDPDGDALSYSVSSSNTSVVGVSISGNNVVITEAGVGSATVTLTADDGNGGTVSDVFSVEVIEEICYAPVNLEAYANISNYNMYLNWEMDGSAVQEFRYDDGYALGQLGATEMKGTREFLGFNVYRDGDKINTSLVTEMSYVDPDLMPNGQYCYQVTAVYSVCGESDFSNEACDAFWDAIPELSLNDISIFPNPSTGLVHISIDNYYKAIDVSVYNILGELVKEMKTLETDHLNIDLSNNERGVYFIKIATDHDSFVKRVVIE